jgi:hypothetical protein
MRFASRGLPVATSFCGLGLPGRASGRRCQVGRGRGRIATSSIRGRISASSM